jgi:uncharacterized repeat protein (TIGR02543 family)
MNKNIIHMLRSNQKTIFSIGLSLLCIFSLFQPIFLYAQETPPRAIPVNESTLQPITSQQQNRNTGASGGAGASGAAAGVGTCLASTGLVSFATTQIGSLLNSVIGGTVPVSDGALNVKETGILGAISLDQLGWCLANSAIDQIGAATVQWINSGFQGSPVFVEDPVQFFMDIADAQAGAFFAELGGGFLCQPLQNIVRINLANTYNSQISQFSDTAQCSFSAVAGNFEQFVSGQSFSWDDWFSYSQNPYNNEMGATIFGQVELDRRIASLVGLEKNKLDWSGGFFSITDKETGKIITPGKVVEDKINEKLGSSQRRLEVADEFNEVVAALVNQLINVSITKIMSPSSSGFGGGGGGSGFGGRSTGQTFTVTFNENGGTGTMATQIFSENEPSNLRNNQFIRSNYNFLGWNTRANGSGTTYTNGSSFTIGSENITLYAQWTQKPIYNLIVNKVGQGTIRSEPSGIRCGQNCSATFEEGAQVVLTANPENPSIFAGWQGAGCTQETTNKCTVTMNQARNITATFAQNTYNLIFNSNGGTGTMIIQVFDQGETKAISPNQFTRAGYVFTGWNTQVDGSGTAYANNGPLTMGSSSVRLFAQWAPSLFSINFAPNGANSGTMSTISNVSPDQRVKLPRNIYTRQASTFAGWATSADGPVVYQDEAEISNITGNITLYAKWNAVEVPVSFNSNGGSGTMAPQIFTRSESKPLSTNTFTRAGFRFMGWATSINGLVEYADRAVYTSGSLPLSLYAVWQAN